MKPIVRSAAASAALAACVFAGPVQAQDFYEATAAELRGRPGTIIRMEPFAGAPGGASAFRVLYRSTGFKGEPVAVSGLIVVPPGEAPAGGREIVAWAHGTTGVARRCAPSLFPQALTWIPGLEAMLARGFVVVATDFRGLGTAGTHPYLVGDSSARSVLDSVRAARDFKEARAGSRFAVWGHSQGGHAALFTGEQARRYAPELQLAGIAAAAPATELAELLQLDLRGPVGKVLGSFALWSWSRVFNIPLQGVVREVAMLPFEKLVTYCNETPDEVARLLFVEQALEREGLLAVNVTKVEPWRRLLAENTPGRSPAGAPVFIAQGTLDIVVRPRVTAEFMRQLCGQGTPVRFLEVPGGDHSASARFGAGPAVDWIAERFAGSSPPNDC